MVVVGFTFKVYLEVFCAVEFFLFRLGKLKKVQVMSGHSFDPLNLLGRVIIQTSVQFTSSLLERIHMVFIQASPANAFDPLFKNSACDAFFIEKEFKKLDHDWHRIHHHLFIRHEEGWSLYSLGSDSVVILGPKLG